MKKYEKREFQLYHTHPNPAWTKASRTEPLLILVPGGSCGKCPKGGK